MDELEIMKFYSLSESYSKEYIEFLIAIAKKNKIIRNKKGEILWILKKYMLHLINC